MARMDEVPRQPWFRFGLAGLFALVAACAVLVSLWNPLVEPRSAPSLNDIKRGMTEAEVAELVGKPDTVETYDGVTITRFQLADGDWIVGYKDGRVYNSFLHRETTDPVTFTPNVQPSSTPTLLNPETTVRRQD